MLALDKIVAMRFRFVLFHAGRPWFTLPCLTLRVLILVECTLLFYNVHLQ